MISCRFERFLVVLSGFGVVLGGFQKDLEGFWRISGGSGGGRHHGGRGKVRSLKVSRFSG